MEIQIDEFLEEDIYNFDKNLKFMEKIAHGSFGTVIHMKDILSNKDLAVKIINKSGSTLNLISKMKEEINILKQLNHENIIKFFGFNETNSKLYIIMEYLPFGTLSTWIKNNIGKINEEKASIIMSKLFSAVEYLHHQQICHRDIKPENVMFGKENDLNSIKLIDFGLSAQHFDNISTNDYCGTFLYMAPEQIGKKSYSQTVDVWALGIILFMLLNNGKHPFYVKGDLKKELAHKIKKGVFKFYNNVSFMANNLIRKLLEINPDWRYTAEKALRHPWITRNKNDEIPKTFNEILTRRNNLKNSKDLLFICIFLNYCNVNRSNKIKNHSFGKIGEKKNNNIFKIDDNYISKVNYFCKVVKDKNNKIKEKCFDVENDFFSRHSIKRISLFQRNSIISILKKNEEYKLSLNKKKTKKEVKINIPKTNTIKKDYKQSLSIDNRKKKNKISLFSDVKRKNSKLILKNIELNSDKTRNKENKFFSEKNNITLSLKYNDKKKEKDLENNILRKSQILPTIEKINYKLNKTIITDVKRKSISIIPLVLPNITPSSRIINKYKIGKF